ncbi:hypothetical protein EXIGLDRAFT_846994 [Exidia glandulosa HHB12029]|uniref:Mid2 domain-containing protein n=1 Tax=Exidia glandulosa HHB12029 TaxID=1314781 RepID=A0A166NB67_EXIGL|nr:hypothetical protein EXIGLDRAFT_846994 [Exidia glandulosa HHB12029]
MRLSLIFAVFTLGFGVRAQDLTTCGRSASEIKWALGSGGETPCRLWWNLGTACYWWALGPLTNNTQYYTPPPIEDECGCNVLAYNLMAACTWCEAEDYSSNWLSERELWKHVQPLQVRIKIFTRTDSSLTLNSGTSSRPSVDISKFSFPDWTFLSPNGGSWSPSRAKAFVVGDPPRSHPGPATATPTSSSPFSHPEPPLSAASVTSTPAFITVTGPGSTVTVIRTEGAASGPIQDYTTSVSDTPPSSGSQVTPTVTPSAETSPAKEHTGDSPAALAGIAIGGFIGAVVLVLLVVLCVVRHRRRTSSGHVYPIVVTPAEPQTVESQSHASHAGRKAREAYFARSEPPPSYYSAETEREESGGRISSWTVGGSATHVGSP